MSDDMKNVNRDDRSPLRVQNVPGVVSRRHAEKITEDAVKDSAASTASGGGNEPEYSLNDDRRVKVLSPGAMVAKRFFRNRIAVVGLAILAFMFLFSFVGGILSPYGENQQFYREDIQHKDYAGVVMNEEFRYAVADGQELGNVLQAQVVLAMQRHQQEFSYRDVDYQLIEEGPELYRVALADGTTLGIAYKDIVSPSVEGTKLSYEFQYQALLAYTNNQDGFSADGKDYTIDDAGVVEDGTSEVAFISRYVVQPVMADVFLTRSFQEELIVCLQDGQDVFRYTDENGVEAEYTITYRADLKTWKVLQETATRVYDTYSYPSRAHWLGTDRNGMDMLTRLMYGGRVSLIIGFIVGSVSIANFLLEKEVNLHEADPRGKRDNRDL